MRSQATQTPLRKVPRALVLKLNGKTKLHTTRILQCHHRRQLVPSLDTQSHSCSSKDLIPQNVAQSRNKDVIPSQLKNPAKKTKHRPKHIVARYSIEEKNCHCYLRDDQRKILRSVVLDCRYETLTEFPYVIFSLIIYMHNKLVIKYIHSLRHFLFSFSFCTDHIVQRRRIQLFYLKHQNGAIVQDFKDTT